MPSSMNITIQVNCTNDLNELISEQFQIDITTDTQWHYVCADLYSDLSDVNIMCQSDPYLQNVKMKLDIIISS